MYARRPPGRGEIDELKDLALGGFDFDNLDALDEDNDPMAYEAAVVEAFEDFFTDYLYENDSDWREIHQDQLEETYHELIGDTFFTLAKAEAGSHALVDTELRGPVSQLFAENLGLRVHYDIIARYHHRQRTDAGNGKLKSANVMAFLMLPRQESKMENPCSNSLIWVDD